jgi:Zn-dependent protease
VLLAEPQKTPWALHFSVLGFPVRVHPLFWVFGLLVGGIGDGRMMLLYLLVNFVSILIHELGHALMIRRFGRESYIVLYMMGGLAIEGNPNPYASSWNPRADRRTPWEQIYISAAGPGAEFLLAGLIAVFVKAMGGDIRVEFAFYVIPIFDIIPGRRISRELELMLEAGLWFNTWWAAVNLLPVHPLDGGQIAQQFFLMNDPHSGLVKSIQLSIITGIGMAIFSFAMQSYFSMFLFGSLAFSNYMMYMQIHGRGGDRW